MKTALVLVGLLAGGCKTVAKGEHFERELAARFKERGHTVAVSCPPRVPLGVVATNTFRCEVVADDGSSAALQVSLDEDGRMSVAVIDGTARPAR
jgi:hypothetical protein